MQLASGKLNIMLGGQFGSEGKGLLASYISYTNHIDMVITNQAPNAGHTYYFDNKKYVLKQLPVSGVLNKRSTIYFCAGAIINPDILLKEIKEFDIDSNRIFIHPHCAIITEDDINHERDNNSSVTKIASTQSGVGSALIRKISRSAKLAKDQSSLSNMVQEIDLSFYLKHGCVSLMEVPQGFSLSINSGMYPFTTSRECTVSSALADAQLHPHYLGKVAVCLRSFPIRVGNIIKDGKELGYSGPFFDDSVELSWDDIGVDAERTTVTQRIRRVATFSMKQYKKMLEFLHPDYVLFNFANYLTKDKLNEFIKQLPEITHIGFGPKPDDVIAINLFF